jgi:hypothetical protein
VTPEVRLSPDATTVAILWSGDGKWFVHGVLTRTATVSAEFVHNWTPLLPASSEDGAA